MRQAARDLLTSTSELTLAAIALFLVALTVADFAGVLENVPWLLKRVPIFALLGIGLLLGAAVLDRRTILKQIQRQLAAGIGVEYLWGEGMVMDALRRQVASARETIVATGAKSTATAYLEDIAGRVREGGTNYYRLLTGDHITHELHQHLLPLLAAPGVTIVWNHSEKYGTFTLSEREVVRVEPTPNPSRFLGFRMTTDSAVRLHNELVTQAVADSIPIKTEKALASLCERCGKLTSRNQNKLTQLLRAELKHS